MDGRSWLPCAAPKWCADYGDRWAASVIHQGYATLFSGGGTRGGFGLIFAPSFNSVLCSYATDGGSMGTRCDNPLTSDPALDHARHCTPGCWKDGPPSWCGRSNHNYGQKVACPFPPEDLDDMMNTHKQTHRGYNEVGAALR